MRLRQIALVAHDLPRAKADVTAVLGLGEDFPDPGLGAFGLANAVWPVGDTFLEVVSPKQEGTTAGRLLEKRGGDGGYMAIFQVADIADARARLAATRTRTVWNHDHKDGTVAATHLHPKDIGGAIVSVDMMEPPERWEWGGPHWREHVKTDVSLEIVGCEIQAEDPDALCARWAEVLGLDRRGDNVLATDGGEIRFAPAADGRGDGLSAFAVQVRDPAQVRAAAQARGCLKAGQVVLCGTRVDLIPAAGR